jgi:hypothetical protein
MARRSFDSDRRNQILKPEGYDMNKILLMLTLVAFSISVSAATASEPKKTEGSGIQWLTSLDQAVKQAKAENKAILLDFYNPS